MKIVRERTVDTIHGQQTSRCALSPLSSWMAMTRQYGHAKVQFIGLKDDDNGRV